MAMGKREREEQPPLWVTHEQLPRSQGHPFYNTLNQVLAHCGFDAWIEEACRPFYAEVMGRPSLPPGVYFRCLLVGYFEGIDSERGIAWRCADSLSLREFLGIALDQNTPDHSTISRTRRLIDLETHDRIFVWVLKVLARSDLIKGKTIGIDATTLEANAALRSIVRHDTGESYEGFLTGLARASGIETPTREDLAKIDKQRKDKASNGDWHNPHDPDAKITKMKDGRTHLAHKHEHASDMGEGGQGAILAVTVRGADEGDTTTWRRTVEEACTNLNALLADPQTAGHVHAAGVQETVTDKGYHSNQTMADQEEIGLRSYCAEPRRGRRDWKGKEREREAVYANRRRRRGARGKRLMRRRGELIERGFAHALESGGMRRVHLRGHPNIRKRLLVHVGGFNLGLVMRKLLGKGTPRGFQGLRAGLRASCAALRGLISPLAGLRIARASAAGRSSHPALKLAAA